MNTTFYWVKIGSCIFYNFIPCCCPSTRACINHQFSLLVQQQNKGKKLNSSTFFKVVHCSSVVRSPSSKSNKGIFIFWFFVSHSILRFQLNNFCIVNPPPWGNSSLNQIQTIFGQRFKTIVDTISSSILKCYLIYLLTFSLHNKELFFSYFLIVVWLPTWLYWRV